MVVAIIIALFIRTFLFQAFRIPSGSMERTLLVGDHLVVNRFVLAPAATGIERAVLPERAARRGDIVVFKFPEEPGRDVVKRVIGLPGETVELRGRRVYIDGRALDEPYIGFDGAPPSAAPEADGAEPDLRVRYGPVTVPPGFLFVLGDNRDNSEDSRYWGYLPAVNVKGRALAVYWSFDPEPVHATGLAGSIADVSGHTRWGRVGTGLR